MGFDVGKIIRDLLFSKLFNFMDKIILEMFRISSTKNTPKALKIRKKFLEIL